MHRSQFHAAVGNGAGLVNDDNIDVAGVFEDLASLDDDPKLRTPAGTHHDA